MKPDMIMVWHDSVANKVLATMRRGKKFYHYAPTLASTRRIARVLAGRQDYDIDPLMTGGIGYSAHRI